MKLRLISKILRPFSALFEKISIFIKYIATCLLWVRLWHGVPVHSWLRAASFYKAGNFYSAAKYYKIGLEKYPNHPASFSARCDLAVCLERLGDFEQAIEEATYIISLRYPLKDCYLLKSKLLSFKGQEVLATEILKISLSIFPTDNELKSKFVLQALRSKSHEKDLFPVVSELRFIKNTLNNESNDMVYIETAIAAYEIEKGDSVLGDSILGRVLSTGDAPYEAYLIRGKQFRIFGKSLQAREMLRRASAFEPRDPLPFIELSRSYLALGEEQDIEWAVQASETACKLSFWKNIEALQVLIDSLSANKQVERAAIFSELQYRLMPSDQLLNYSNLK